ncbi:hypothetical protein Ancab_026157 [Ancistrocladus abbreviatus]
MAIMAMFFGITDNSKLRKLIGFVLMMGKPLSVVGISGRIIARCILSFGTTSYFLPIGLQLFNALISSKVSFVLKQNQRQSCTDLHRRNDNGGVREAFGLNICGRRLFQCSPDLVFECLLYQVFEELDVPKKKTYAQSGEILSVEKLIAEAYLAIDKAVKVGTLRTRNYKENHSLQEERRQRRSTLAGIALLLLQWLLHRTHFDSATVIMSSKEGVIDQHGLDDSLETNEEIITVPRELWSWDIQTHCSSLERNIGRTLINLNGKLRR